MEKDTRGSRKGFSGDSNIKFWRALSWSKGEAVLLISFVIWTVYFYYILLLSHAAELDTRSIKLSFFRIRC